MYRKTSRLSSLTTCLATHDVELISFSELIQLHLVVLDEILRDKQQKKRTDLQQWCLHRHDEQQRSSGPAASHEAHCPAASLSQEYQTPPQDYPNPCTISAVIVSPNAIRNVWQTF